ncbi:hypothetical protein J3Q64DRAFT_1694501 [Phycomyces blakesleeanus]|uniref:Uncharacterized protein n=2 Tax=Phycomyces blakesleeanus TaxID=4837 RepID=A0A167QN12_PHYB8|nr:hypothetical protein PHYBLDRAFT_58999 [Phycomyces blakesleeanus NRRL 1555(-)]OAD79954.1 hypothetical protein PHYBLDRAFT_58999 [Phycomyces blakesleeanus NRRL 1555(-)]|eukprot:XP_018297994.1 hypothetical protein PHYBLDRAFT_58999 [Phycomyces blakesleeanus NRRL 1555(-)]
MQLRTFFKGLRICLVIFPSFNSAFTHTRQVMNVKTNNVKASSTVFLSVLQTNGHSSGGLPARLLRPLNGNIAYQGVECEALKEFWLCLGSLKCGFKDIVSSFILDDRLVVLRLGELIHWVSYE